MATQAERIAELELRVVELVAMLTKIGASTAELAGGLKAVSTHTVAAHDRLDAAGQAFKKLNMALKAEPFHVPVPVEKRLPRAEFDAALQSLRDEDREHGGSQSFFPVDMVRRRAATLRAQEHTTAE